MQLLGWIFIFQWPCRIRCWESSYEQLYQKQERLAYHLQFLQELTTTENHRYTFWPRSLLFIMAWISIHAMVRLFTGK